MVWHRCFPALLCLKCCNFLIWQELQTVCRKTQKLFKMRNRIRRFCRRIQIINIMTTNINHLIQRNIREKTMSNDTNKLLLGTEHCSNFSMNSLVEDSMYWLGMVGLIIPCKYLARLYCGVPIIETTGRRDSFACVPLQGHIKRLGDNRLEIYTHMSLLKHVA